MIYNHATYTYETPYKVPFVITQCWANGTVTLQCGAIKIMYNIWRIKTHTSDTNVEDINLKILIDDVKLVKYLLYNSLLY